MDEWNAGDSPEDEGTSEAPRNHSDTPIASAHLHLLDQFFTDQEAHTPSEDSDNIPIEPDFFDRFDISSDGLFTTADGEPIHFSAGDERDPHAERIQEQLENLDLFGDMGLEDVVDTAGQLEEFYNEEGRLGVEMEPSEVMRALEEMETEEEEGKTYAEDDKDNPWAPYKSKTVSVSSIAKNHALIAIHPDVPHRSAGPSSSVATV